MTASFYDIKPRAATRLKEFVFGDTSLGDRALVGELAELGPSTKAYISLDFEHVIGIFGKRGSGKSFLLGALVEALSWKDKNSVISRITVPRGAVLFDLLNIFQWMPAEPADKREANFVLYHVPGYAPPTTHSTPLAIRPQDVDADEWCILFGIDGIREPMGQCLVEAVAEARRRRVSSIAGLIQIVGAMSDRFASETIRALSQRFGSYQTFGIFDELGITLSSLCNANATSILLFAGVPEDVRSLYVFLVLRKVYEERVRSSQIEKAQKILASAHPTGLENCVPKMWLFIDEAQNVIPPRNSGYAVDTLIRYVREGRNYGLSLCFTTQQPSAIDTRIMSQLDTLVSFILTTPSDIAVVKGNLKSAFPKDVKLRGRALSFEDTLRSLKVGQCLVSNQDAVRSILVQIRERLTPHGGFEG
jgi:DNA helicase HerA-like ATPase